MKLKLNITEIFNKELPADPNERNTRRQVRNACFSYVTPRKPSDPSLVHVSPEMGETLGIMNSIKSKDFLNVFSGAKVMKGTKPYAMCYGGHQFGNWAGQLGDGRAINLAEVENNGKTWALQLKGAGETPYSRTADGLAVLRSSIREYLCSEAMYHLGVPTTRALSLILSGDQVLRDVMYDGNPAYEKGAIVCRVSPSFIRFGNFEILAAQDDVKTLRELTDFTIKHYFSYLGKPSKDTYLAFFKEVAVKSLEMVMHWQRVGFVHGVMNTDNMSILGQTIDYGPYGWLEGYDHGWTPNTTDKAHKRYRYGTQPQVVLWNLLKLANALYPLIEEAEPLQAVLAEYQDELNVAYLNMMKSKLGLYKTDENDQALVVSRQWKEWFSAYRVRLKLEEKNDVERVAGMNAVNPKYVLRNYMAQLAIDAADKGDYTILDELFNLLKKPYDEQPDSGKWFAKRPEWARNKVGCSMLSCSS